MKSKNKEQIKSDKTSSEQTLLCASTREASDTKKKNIHKIIKNITKHKEG